MDVVNDKHAHVDVVHNEEDFKGLLLVHLGTVHLLQGLANPVNTVAEKQVGDDDGKALEVDARVGLILEILYTNYLRVKYCCYLGHGPLKVREERWVVQRPN